MNSEEIRSRFLKFFEDRGHKIVPSSSLIPPESDDSTLFVSAGVQPLAPYILGEKHPLGRRIVNIQKCVRVQDIEEVGDNTHDTFFEMMGNWSFDDYFKEEAIKWSYELLTDEKEGFGLDPKRLYITVFEGDENAPQDLESFEIWKKYMPESRIYFMSAKSNWWSAGDNGPCGPDTEMFYDITTDGLGDLTKEEYIKADDEQKVVEIWNDVFMEYLKKDGKVVGKLETRNVDTGSGLERIVMAVQKKNNIFDTDLFEGAIQKINRFSKENDLKAKRIVADHIRTSVFMISDGVLPSNTGRSHVLRSILRRAIRYADKLNLDEGLVGLGLVNFFIDKYKHTYKNLEDKEGTIKGEILKEEEKFRKTLRLGLGKLQKVMSHNLNTGEKIERSVISAATAFDLYQNYGFPIELTVEEANRNGLSVDINGFNKYFEDHQKISKQGSEQKFKGGLAGHSEIETKYHTATHLLHQALRDVLGVTVEQRGSNITPERLRFDFSHPTKMTDEEKKKVEDIVNEKIAESLKVNKVVMKKEEAEKIGALHFFGDKYGDEVSVYYIGDSLESAYSKEFCGGPHVSNTSELASVADPERKSKGPFKIIKEEASSAGIRRIKAVLE